MCKDIVDQRGLVEALFSEISAEFLFGAALGIGNAEHPEPVAEGEITRKGISCERTFAAISKWQDLESMVSSSDAVQWGRWSCLMAGSVGVQPYVSCTPAHDNQHVLFSLHLETIFVIKDF